MGYKGRKEGGTVAIDGIMFYNKSTLLWVEQYMIIYMCISFIFCCLLIFAIAALILEAIETRQSIYIVYMVLITMTCVMYVCKREIVLCSIEREREILWVICNKCYPWSLWGEINNKSISFV